MHINTKEQIFKIPWWRVHERERLWDSPRAANWDFLEEPPAASAPAQRLKAWSLFLGGAEAEESRLAAAACSGVLYFLGLPRFLFTLSIGGDTAADGSEPVYTMWEAAAVVAAAELLVELFCTIPLVVGLGFCGGCGGGWWWWK